MIIRGSVAAYGMSLAVVAAAVGVRVLLDPILGDRLPFITLFVAIVFMAWQGGRGPALLTLVVGLGAAAFFLLHPRYSFAIDQFAYQVGLVFYAVIGYASIAMFEASARKQRRLEEEVAARQAAEQVLAEREEFLRVTLASIGDGVITTDPNGNVISLNGVAQELTGWTREEAHGQPLTAVFKIINEESRQPVENPVENALREGRVVGLANHTLLVRKDGTERPIGDSAAPIRDDKGQIVGVVLIFRDISKRWETETQLRQSERELADFFENASVGLHWVGPDGTILRANQAELDMLGYNRDEYIGRLIADFHADAEVISDILKRLQAGEKLAEYPARLRCKDGSIKEVLIDSSVLFREGRFVHTRCFTRDVTERKQAEAKVRAQEQRMRLATAATSVGIWEWNIVTGQIKWDAQMFRIYGVAPTPDGVVPNETWSSAVVPEDLRRQEEILQDTVRRLGHSNRDFRIRRADDGECRHIQSVETIRSDEQGRAEWVVGTNLDITDRSKHVAILAGQKRVLELLVHDAPLPDVLDALCEVTEGQSHQQLIAMVLLVDEGGQRLRYVAGRRAPPDYARAVDGVVIDPCAGSCGAAAFRGEQVIVSDIATDPLWADYRELALGHGLRACWSTPIVSSQGKVLGTFDVYYPTPRRPSPEEMQLVEILTRTAGVAIERRRDEQALRDADRRKDEFLATLAHELRNPLAPVKNSLGLMKRASGSADLIEQARSTMERQVGHMVRLIDDLLDVSRITRNKLELKKERVELASVVHHAVEACRPLAERAGHELLVTLPPQPIYLNADQVRLAQVVGNLLTNSCKYTKPGGRIWLTAERQGNDVTVMVKDTGIGIPPDMLPKVFDLFTQVDRSMERSEGGLGIGLSLVKRLVELHDGTVTAHSEGQDNGSEFVVRLPMHIDKSTPQPIPQLSTEPTMIKARRILVVDDNRDNSDSLAMLLELTGIETQTAYDGVEAVEKASAFRPAMILLDIGLPKMNGYAACRAIREQPWGKDIVMIALTGWGQDDDRRKSKEAGFDGHLVKPVDDAALMKLLASGSPDGESQLTKR